MDTLSGNQAPRLGDDIMQSKSATLVLFIGALSTVYSMFYSLKTTNPIEVVFRHTTSR
jgi:hypothetical protein